MIRVALISEYASPLATLGGVDSGGQNVYVAQLARRLTERGYEVDIFTRRDDPALASTVPWGGARIVHVPAGPAQRIRKEDLLPHMDEFTRFMVRSIREEGGYDLVHANFFMSALVAAELKRQLGIPFVVTFHALGRVRRYHHGGADLFPVERLAIEDRVVAEADRIIAECPQDRFDLETMYGADRRKLRGAPCGFDEAEFSPLSHRLARQLLGIDPDAFTILQLGRMVPRKGVDNVIRGLAMLRRRHGIDGRLLVVGGETRDPDPRMTPEFRRLAAIARAENVSDLVTFVGSRRRDELRAFYAACDVFVTTPWYEPFGMTPIEAMACARPVIGSSVGGIRYTVRDGKTGFLVPPNDPETLAERLALFAKNPVLGARMGLAAVRRARRSFTWDRVTERITQIYDGVLTSIMEKNQGHRHRRRLS